MRGLLIGAAVAALAGVAAIAQSLTHGQRALAPSLGGALRCGRLVVANCGRQ